MGTSHGRDLDRHRGVYPRQNHRANVGKMTTRGGAEVSAATDLEAALRDLATALAAPDRERSRDARMRAGRLVLVRHCVALLGIEPPGQLSVAAIIKLAAESPARPARRSCAVLMVHALAMPGLVPPGSAATSARWWRARYTTCCCGAAIHSADRSSRRCMCWNGCTRRSVN